MSEIPAAARMAIEGLRSLGGDGLLRQMVSVFLQHSRDQTLALESAATAGDLVAAAAVAHSLKGSALQLGLTVLGDACVATERAAKAGDISATQAKAAAVRVECAAAANWLAQLTA